MDYTGQTALITGASSGIGVAYARELARRGADLVLVARRAEKLEELAATVRAESGRKAHVLAADLGLPGAGRDLAERVADLGVEVDVLINNAGFGTHGDLVDTDAERLIAEVQLNCVAVVDLTRRFLPGMIARGRGTVVNVASTASFQPIPHMAVYGATKAFVRSFTEALWAEAKPAGVRVIAICPGATETPFFETMGTEDAAVGSMRTTEQVVASTLGGLRRGAPTVIDGFANAALAHATRFMPRRLLIAIAGRAVTPRSKVSA